jgi:hypothetical protein
MNKVGACCICAKGVRTIRHQRRTEVHVSTILYGATTREAELNSRFRLEDGTTQTPDQRMSKITQAVTALVPAEVLAVHAAVLALATVVGDDGTTTVTKPDLLKWTLPILAGTAVILFLIGHRGKFARIDAARALVPALAFVAWTLLTGTSAATPWVEDVDRGWLVLGGGVLAACVVALAVRLAPKT